MKLRSLFGWVFGVVSSALLVGTPTVHGQNFANFSQQGNDEGWVYNDTNTSGTTTFSTPTGSLVYFQYVIPGLPTYLQGNLDAIATFTSSNPSNATGSPNYTQLFNTVTSTLSFIGTSGAYTGANLLTATFTYRLTATDGENTATASSIIGSVNFTSDYLDFSNSTALSRSVVLSFDAIDAPPGITLTGNFIDSFTATGGGQFSSNPRPILVPEINTGMVFFAISMLAIGGEWIRKRRKALVPVPVAVKAQA